MEWDDAIEPMFYGWKSLWLVVSFQVSSNYVLHVPTFNLSIKLFTKISIQKLSDFIVLCLDREFTLSSKVNRIHCFVKNRSISSTVFRLKTKVQKRDTGSSIHSAVLSKSNSPGGIRIQIILPKLIDSRFQGTAKDSDTKILRGLGPLRPIDFNVQRIF